MRAARQDARAQARRRDRAGRPEPLELRRRHAVAHRPLGVARASPPTWWCRSTASRRWCSPWAARIAEAARRECANALTDVRHSRSGKYAEVMVERLKELKLERGRIGLIEVDPRHNDYLPVNQYNVLRQSLPDAELVFTKGFMHELVVIHSEEELRLRAQGRRAVPARHGGDDRARQARRAGIRAARRGRRRDPGWRRRHRLPHHRHDADGQSGAWCSAIRGPRTASC